MSDNPHPAHKEILDVIPESLHSVVIPVLKKWDQGVHDKLTEVRNEFSDYEAYKPFVENNIDPNFVHQAVVLMHELQQDPEKAVKQMHEVFELDFVKPSEVTPPEEDDDLDLGNDDFLKHPEVQKMIKKLDEMDKSWEQRQLEDEENRAQSQLQEELARLKGKAEEDKLPYDEHSEKFVLALMSQGVPGDKALEEYYALLAKTVKVDENESTEQTPPVVMGDAGTTGSGSSSDAIDVSGSKESVNDLVEKMILAQQESGQ